MGLLKSHISLLPHIRFGYIKKNHLLSTFRVWLLSRIDPIVCELERVNIDASKQM